jgi:hypothetical protein
MGFNGNARAIFTLEAIKRIDALLIPQSVSNLQLSNPNVCYEP